MTTIASLVAGPPVRHEQGNGQDDHGEPAGENAGGSLAHRHRGLRERVLLHQRGGGQLYTGEFSIEDRGSKYSQMFTKDRYATSADKFIKY